MWKKIKDWFTNTFDVNNDGKVTVEDAELAKAIAEQEFKKANQAINAVNDQITDSVTQVKKKAKSPSRKKK